VGGKHSATSASPRGASCTFLLPASNITSPFFYPRALSCYRLVTYRHSSFTLMYKHLFDDDPVSYVSSCSSFLFLLIFIFFPAFFSSPPPVHRVPRGCLVGASWVPRGLVIQRPIDSCRLQAVPMLARRCTGANMKLTRAETKLTRAETKLNEA
jgi:hypothetical protein